MKEESIKYITEFLIKPSIFFESLQDYSVFNKEEFHKYTSAIYELSQSSLSIEERYEIVVTIWEVSFKIVQHLGYHKDSEDYTYVKNIDDNEILQIRNICFYTANWFSHRKELDKGHLIIGSWQ